jgi:hypothetical protein
MPGAVLDNWSSQVGDLVVVAVPMVELDEAAGVCLLLPHAAINAVAAAVPTPSRARRRNVSRRDSRPSTC